MSAHTPYVASSDLNLNRDQLERVLELTGGENPVRFLRMSEPDTTLAIIRGITDLDRLEGWRHANQSFMNPPIPAVTKALDERERELTGESKPETPKPKPEPTPEPEPEPVGVHPDSRLEAGETLVIERGERTEYVTAQRAGADAPYVSITCVDGEPTTDPVTLLESDLLRRTKEDSERRPVDTAPDCVGGVSR